MKSIINTLVALLPFAAALPNAPPKSTKAAKGKVNYGPHNAKCHVGKTFPIDFSFMVSVPTIADVGDITPSIRYGGYRFGLPREALSGVLVSFLGNFDVNQTTTSQITTVTNATSIEGGISYTNASASANGTTIVALSYSSGNASSAGAAAQADSSVTSTSSSSEANSSAVAVADTVGVVAITVSASTDSASDSQSLQNAQEAAAATSCAANNEGATASAELSTTVIFTTAGGTTVTSVAYAACQAGVEAPSTESDSGSSSAGSQASLADVAATATCDGVVSTNQFEMTTFRLAISGVWVCGSGFQGAITGQRVAEAESSC